MNKSRKPSSVARRLGRAIASKRVALGLSQFDVADRLGLTSPETVSRYERGEREPRVSTLIRLGEVLQTSATELCREAEVGVRRPPEQAQLAAEPGWEAGEPELLEAARVLQELDPTAARLMAQAVAGVVRSLIAHGR